MEKVDGDPIRYDLVPNPLLADGLERYIEGRIPTGSFLDALLCNNLREAVWRADSTNVLLLRALIDWLWYYAPAACWGSRDKVRAWLEVKG